MASPIWAALITRFATARYALAVLAVAGAIGLRLAFEPVLGTNTPYLTFFGAVVLVRHLAGRGPALAATALSVLSVWYFLLEPRYSFAVAQPSALVALGLYAVISVAISLLEPRAEALSRRVTSPLPAGDPVSVTLVRRIALIAGAALAIGILAMLLWSGLQRSVDAERLVEHTYQVLSAASSVRSHLEGAQTSERGYLLTGEDQYIEAFQFAVASERQARATLRRLTVDNHLQQQRLDEFDRLARLRIEMLSNSIEVRKSRGASAVAELVRTARGGRLMDQLRGILDAVDDEEHRLLHVRTEAAAAADLRTRWILGLGCGSLVLLLILAGASIERHIQERNRAEQLLALRARLIDLSPDAIITTDGDRVITGWNSGAQEMYGWTAKEAIGQTLHETLHTNSPVPLAEVNCVLEREGRWHGELAQVRSDGRSIVVDSRQVLHRDKAGQPAGYLEINRDITERNQTQEALRQSESRLRSLGNSLPEAAIYKYRVDANGEPHVDFISEGIERLTGVPAAEFMADHHTVERSIVAEDRRSLNAAIELSRERMTRFELEIRHKHRVTGEIRWSILRSTPMPNEDGSTSWDGIELDITERKRSDEALRVSEEKFAKAFATNPAALALTRLKDGVIIDVNGTWQDMMGHNRDEAIGCSTVDLGTWPTDEDRARYARELAERGTLHGREQTLMRRSGQPFTALMSASVLTIGGEQVAISAWLDISERKKSEEALRVSEDQFRTLANAIPQLCWMANADGWIFWYNNRWYEYTGTTPEQMEGWGWQSVHDPETLPKVLERWRASISTGQPFDMVFPLRGADGLFRPFLTRVTPLYDRDGKAVRWFGTNTDISEQRRIEEALRESEEQLRGLNAELERRVLDRTAQLESANKELEAFAYSVSHDLRAPLRGIDGWSLALIEDYGSALEQRALQYLGRVRSETQRMGRLIDDLLQLSRITRMEMHRDAVDLSGIAETIAGRLREAQSQRRLEFAIAPGLTAFGDARLLEVALTNLLDNAVKFTGTRAETRIAFETAERNGKAAFVIRDNGVGFDMAYASTLFGAFQRLHSEAEFPGTGIGLATVQRVIHRHGGRIWAEAEPDRGASFYFTIGGEK